MYTTRRPMIAGPIGPPVRTLLIALALTVALWFIPYADALTYPLRLFATFIHEGIHALAALLTGNHVLGLRVAPNGGGATYTTANGATANMQLGTRDFLIQRNWVNASGGYCSLS